MGRPREHTDATAGALLDAAERLLAGSETASLSVREVAAEAGTSTRAVYALFGSKAGLVDALGARLFQLLAGAIDALPRTDDPVADVATASVEGFRRVALAHPALYRLVFLDPQSTAGPLRQEHGDEAFARLEALLHRALAGRGVATATARQAAQAVHALTEGLATVDLRGGLGADRTARSVWRSAVTALVRGYAPGTPS